MQAWHEDDVPVRGRAASRAARCPAASRTCPCPRRCSRRPASCRDTCGCGGRRPRWESRARNIRAQHVGRVLARRFAQRRRERERRQVVLAADVVQQHEDRALGAAAIGRLRRARRPRPGGAGGPPRRAARRGLCDAQAQLRGVRAGVVPLREGYAIWYASHAGPGTLQRVTSTAAHQPEHDARGGAQAQRSRRRIGRHCAGAAAGASSMTSRSWILPSAMPDWPSRECSSHAP